jgi:hypothetical protein
MAAFSITGAKKITITNTSVDTVVNVSNDAVISPTLIPSTNTASEVTPALTVFVPSYKSYRSTAIAPKDSITFTTDVVDEILYYKDLEEKSIDNVTVKVENAD